MPPIKSAMKKPNRYSPMNPKKGRVQVKAPARKPAPVRTQPPRASKPINIPQPVRQTRTTELNPHIPDDIAFLRYY